MMAAKLLIEFCYICLT